jgi:hypothetical protein
MAEQADKATRRLFETNSAFADAACAQLACTDTIRSGLRGKVERLFADPGMLARLKFRTNQMA